MPIPRCVPAKERLHVLAIVMIVGVLVLTLTVAELLGDPGMQ